MSQKIEIILTAVDKTKAALDSAMRGFKALGPAADAASAALSNFGVGIPVSVAAGIAAAAAATVNAARSAADYADNMGKLAQRAGVGTEAMSALAYAANQADVDNEQLAKGLREIAVDAASGGEKLKALGVSLTDAGGNAKTADQLFLDVAARFAEMPDGIGKTNAAIDLFGSKVGPQLIPLLNAGSDGLRSAAEEAAAFGRIVTDDAAKAAEEFNDNLTKIQEVSKGVSAEIGNAVIPTLNRLAEEFLDARRAGLGLWEMLNLIWRTQPQDPGEQIRKLTSDIDGLKKKLEELPQNGWAVSVDRKNIADQIASLERQRDYFKRRQRDEALSLGEGVYSNEGLSRTPHMPAENKNRPDKSKNGKSSTYTDPLADDARAYAQAMQQINKAQIDASISGETLTETQKRLVELVNDPAFQNWPEEWQLVTLEAGKYAIAAEQAADEQKRLNELLGDTDSSKIAAARYDMDLLTKAYEQGKISEQKYIEATSARLDDFQGGSRDTLQRTGEYAQDFFGGLSRALTDFNGDVGESFKRTVLGMIQKVMQLEMEMAMMAAYKGGGGSSGGGIFGLIGSFVGSLFGGGGGIDTSFTSGMGSAASMNMGNFDWTFSKNGNVFSGSPSLHAFANTVQTTPTPFVFDQRQAFAKGGVFAEAGPEAVMPLHRDASGRLGVYAQAAPQAAPNVEVVVNNLGTPQTYQQTESRMSDGRTQITLTAADVYQRGELAQALEATYPMLQRIGT